MELAGLGHEEAVLAEFKKAVQDAGLRLPPEFVINGDVNATLRRFLRARKYRLAAAMAMLESESGGAGCGRWLCDRLRVTAVVAVLWQHVVVAVGWRLQ
jgi:hypothetical protein